MAHHQVLQCVHLLVRGGQGLEWQEVVVAEVQGVHLELVTQGGHLGPAADQALRISPGT